MEFDVINIRDYPQDGNHQEVIFDLPYQITKGQDTFYYFDKEKKERKNHPKKWICLLDREVEYSFKENDFEIKQFDTAEEAVEYCKKHYIKWLKKRLKEVEEKTT